MRKYREEGRESGTEEASRHWVSGGVALNRLCRDHTSPEVSDRDKMELRESQLTIYRHRLMEDQI